MTKIHDSLRVRQSELMTAHEEMVREDDLRRRLNRLSREEWEARGGPQAEERHFDWLRRMPEGVAV